MNTRVVLLAALIAAPAAPAFAVCKGAQIHGDGEVPVQIQARQIKAASSGRNVVDYGVSLGPDNSMEVLCLHGGGSVVLTLADSGRYDFRDIRFEYPYGFEPAASPFKLAVVHADSVVFHMASSPVSDGLLFKYTLLVKDVQTGAVLVIDPMIGTDPRPP